MSAQDSRNIENFKIMLVKGADGRGIESIEKTSTSGIYDTYTITYDDGSKTTYTIANGNGIESVEKTATAGLVDTYTITFDNGMIETFEVTNGTSIANIAKTGTSGAVDTYTITLTNGDTYTFEVVNGDGSLATDIRFDDTNAQLGATTAQGAIDAIAKPTFTEASSRANINTGEKLSVIFGKIKKFFADLKAVAFSGSYNDLSDTPSIPVVPTMHDVPITKLAGSMMQILGYVYSSNLNEISIPFLDCNGDTMQGDLVVDHKGTRSILTLGNDSPVLTADASTGTIEMYIGQYKATIQPSQLSANATINLPNKGGTLALLSDIGGSLKKTEVSSNSILLLNWQTDSKGGKYALLGTASLASEIIAISISALSGLKAGQVVVPYFNGKNVYLSTNVTDPTTAFDVDSSISVKVLYFSMV